MTSKREDRETLIEAEIFKIESTHHFHGDTCLCGFSSARSRSRTEHITTMVRAVFEQAHTPTGDERESGRLAIEGVLKACMLTFATSYEDAAGMAIDAVFDALRRPVQGEPTDARTLEEFLGKLAGPGAYALNFTSAHDLHDHIVRLLKRDIAAVRAAAAVTEQG